MLMEGGMSQCEMLLHGHVSRNTGLGSWEIASEKLAWAMACSMSQTYKPGGVMIRHQSVRVGSEVSVKTLREENRKVCCVRGDHEMPMALPASPLARDILHTQHRRPEPRRWHCGSRTALTDGNTSGIRLPSKDLVQRNQFFCFARS
jgi:hypothetical protein